jgi:hypothetical protein
MATKVLSKAEIELHFQVGVGQVKTQAILSIMMDCAVHEDRN